MHDCTMTAEDFFKATEMMRAGDSAGAAPLLRKVVADSPDHVAAWHKLAEALAILGDEAASAEARHAGDSAEARHLADVGASLLFHSHIDRARTCFERALAIDPDCIQAHWLLGDYHGQNGRREEALAHYRRCMEIEPDRPAPAFMAAAFGEGEKPARAPDDYIVEYFDWYAHHFDEHLTERLKYIGPEVTDDTLTAARPGGLGRVLDLGCGTGLVGARLRDRAERLVGLDLSPDMLARARERDLYDELIEGEIEAELRKMPDACFEVVTAADVLIYVGALDATFEQVSRVLTDDGIFVSTFEAAEGDATWVLSETGRYLHGADYIVTAGLKAGFGQVNAETAFLREEYDVPVPSLVVTFQVRT